MFRSELWDAIQELPLESSPTEFEMDRFCKKLHDAGCRIEDDRMIPVMDEKSKMYMHEVGQTKRFYASSFNDMGTELEGVKYFHGTNGLTTGRCYHFYKSVRGLAVALRKAGFHAVDQTK